MENKERLDIAFKRMDSLVQGYHDDKAEGLIDAFIELPVTNGDLEEFLELRRLARLVKKDELSDYLDIFSWSNVKSSVAKTIKAYFKETPDRNGLDFFTSYPLVLLANISTYTGITIVDEIKEDETRKCLARFMAKVLSANDELYTSFKEFCYNPPVEVKPFPIGTPRETKLLLEDIDTRTE